MKEQETVSNEIVSNEIVIKRNALMDDEGHCDITVAIDKYRTAFVRRPSSDGTFSYLFDFHNEVFKVKTTPDRLVAIRQPGITIGHVNLSPDNVILEIKIYESMVAFFSFKRELLQHDFSEFIGRKLVAAK